MPPFRHADTRLLAALVLAYGVVAAAAFAWLPAAAGLVALGAATASVLGLQLYLYRRRQADDVERLEHMQALLWLTEHLRLHRPLPPLTRWAATPQLAAEIVARIEAGRPDVVVEVGSGSSTLVAAYALERLGAGRIVSFEAEAAYAEATRALLAQHGLAHRACVVHAPLRDVVVEGRACRWYDPELVGEALAGLPRVDLLVVDGPPGETHPQARWPALPLVADRLALHAVVMLDDAYRPDEQAVLRRWLEAWPGFACQYVASTKGVAVLVREARPDLAAGVQP